MQKHYPFDQTCQIPAACYNHIVLARSRNIGYLEIALPGLADNVLRIFKTHWECWNRKLGVKLITWQNFRPHEREGLDQAVSCSMTLHHSYSRTIIYRVYDCLLDASSEPGRLIKEKTFGIVVTIPSPLAV